MKRDVDDLLRDLRSAGRGQVRIVERDPSSDDAARREAESIGIQPVQFNVIGQAELQVKQGWLGLVIQHGAETETHPLRPAQRRSGVPAGLGDPAPDPGEEAGRRAGDGGRGRGRDLQRAGVGARQVVRGPPAGPHRLHPAGARRDGARAGRHPGHRAGCSAGATPRLPRAGWQRARARARDGGVAARAHRAAAAGGVERAAAAVWPADPHRHGVRPARQRSHSPPDRFRPGASGLSLLHPRPEHHGCRPSIRISGRSWSPGPAPSTRPARRRAP